MLAPRISRGKPEVVYMIVRNLHSAALGDGEAVKWMKTGDSPPTGYTWIPGVDVVQTAASGETGVAGIVASSASVAQGDYTKMQVWGLHTNVKTTAAALAVDTVVQGDAAGAVVAASAAAAADITKRRVGVGVITGSGNRAGVFIRCM